jgi:hypothetical protein
MISIIIRGGLGNQIFQVLCALGYKNKSNKKLILANNLVHTNVHQYNDKEITILTLKKIFPDIEFVDNLDTTHFYNYNEKCNEAFTYNAIEIQPTNMLLNGYFINEKYFPDDFLNLYNYCIVQTPKTIKYNTLTNNFQNTYFIHIRLGDYVNHNLYTINLIEYYNYCINKIKEQDPLAQFIICTNEYGSNFDNHIKHFPKNNEYIIQDINNDALDTLYIMSSCKGGICSNSTLSWLGSYFQKNKNKNKDFIFMPYPWVNFIYGFTYDNTNDVYPKWCQIYDTITNDIK